MNSLYNPDKFPTLIVLIFCNWAFLVPYLFMLNKSDHQRVHQEALEYREFEPLPVKRYLQKLLLRACFFKIGNIHSSESDSNSNKFSKGGITNIIMIYS